MKMLIRMLNATKCMEVGAYTGYNACSMVLALPGNGKVVCDVTSEYLDAGKPFIQRLEGAWEKFEIHIKPALDTMARFHQSQQRIRFHSGCRKENAYDVLRESFVTDTPWRDCCD